MQSNKSFQTMKFRGVWKTSNVCAIPKITLSNRAEELRLCISLTSVISKVQESHAVECILVPCGYQKRNQCFLLWWPCRSSAVLALVHLAHNCKNIDSMETVVMIDNIVGVCILVNGLQ